MRKDIITSKRLVSGEYHVAAGHAWLQYGEPSSMHSPLVYSAFEFRCAVERLVTELYTLMLAELPGIVEVKEKGSFSRIVKIIHEMGGGDKVRLKKTLTFNQIVSELHPFQGKTLCVPDVGKLAGFWSKLSKLCHSQLSPGETWDDPAWVQKGYALLTEATTYLHHLLVDHWFGAMPDGAGPPEVLDAKARFLEGELDAVALRTRLTLMAPVLESRLRWKSAS